MRISSVLSLADRTSGPTYVKANSELPPLTLGTLRVVIIKRGVVRLPGLLPALIPSASGSASVPEPSFCQFQVGAKNTPVHCCEVTGS